MPTNFLELLACHCAPTMCGVKCANLFNISKKKFPKANNYINEINTYNKLRCFVLEEREDSYLILLYDVKELKKRLFLNKEVFDFLSDLNYPNTSIIGNLNYLKQRINSLNTFPHEIGAFLDYPIEDIKGFLNNDKCLYTGYWKVYKNVDEKKAIFSQYNECKEYVYNLLNRELSIDNLFKERI